MNLLHNLKNLKLITLLVFVVLIVASSPVQAQFALNCGGLASRDQLDFWAGSWNVYSDDGTFAGRHVVNEREAGCLIEAIWTGVDGNSSQSLTTFDPILSQWRQLFVSPAEIADLRGSRTGSTMTLGGNLFTNATQTTSRRRLRLTANGDDTVAYIIDERAGDADPWTEVQTLTARAVATDPNSPATPIPSEYQPGQPRCWGLPNRGDFAFAAGDWSVGTSSDRMASLQAGCLIREQWSAQGGSGVSYNFFDPFVNQWRQVWVSSQNFIDITGGLRPDGAMHLTGSIRGIQSTQTLPYRGTWTDVNSTIMTQLLEQQTNGVWGNWFSGTYVRKTNTASASIAFSGLGAGAVSSSPFGINCASGVGVCSFGFRLDEPVTFSGSPIGGSSFAGWTDGPCFGQAGDCALSFAQDTTFVARFTLDSVPDGRIVAAVLPGARSTYVGGGDVTVFASVVSRASTPAQSCTIAAPDGAPASLQYRRVDATNSAIGPPNPVFDLAAGGTASFVLGITPNTATSANGYTFAPVINCENALLASVPGVNTFALSIDTVPVPDILSISATPSGDGVIRIADSGGISFMTAAAINIGAGDNSAGAGEATITVTADDGGANLPLTLQVCETGPQGGCLAPRANSVASVFGADAKFFAVFARSQAGSAINFNPGGARVFLRFRDANGVVRSVTSAAVTAQE